jgi:hypothetical protein
MAVKPIMGMVLDRALAIVNGITIHNLLTSSLHLNDKLAKWKGRLALGFI